jgi:hypothetical protein
VGLAQESRMLGSLSQSKESTLQSFYMKVKFFKQLSIRGPMRKKSKAFLEWLRINPRKVDHKK